MLSLSHFTNGSLALQKCDRAKFVEDIHDMQTLGKCAAAKAVAKKKAKEADVSTQVA